MYPIPFFTFTNVNGPDDSMQSFWFYGSISVKTLVMSCLAEGLLNCRIQLTEYCKGIMQFYESSIEVGLNANLVKLYEQCHCQGNANYIMKQWY